MWAIVYTDASHKFGQSAWSFWVTSNEGRIIRDGLCPEWISNITEAELYAVYMAVSAVCFDWNNIPIDGFNINCDNASVCKFLSRHDKYFSIRPKKCQKTLRKLLIKIERLIGDRQVKVNLIRSHQNPDKSTAAYINNKCDQYAKKHLGISDIMQARKETIS